LNILKEKYGQDTRYQRTKEKLQNNSQYKENKK